MTSDHSKQLNNKRLPHLGEFGVAILEHYVTSLIGAGAVGKLREPNERNKLFISLARSLERTEDEFLKSSQNDVRNLLLQLPLRKDQDLLYSLREFSINPGSLSLPKLLVAKIKKYAPTIKEDVVVDAVEEYLNILRKELVSVPEVRAALSAWASIETSQSVKKIEEHSSETVNLLKQLVDNIKVSTRSPNVENQLNLNENNDLVSRTPQDIHSQYYVIRQQDKDLKRELRQAGVTITVKGPRKTGKTLLLSNLLSKVEKKYVYIDLETIDDRILNQGDSFYTVFCELIASELNIKTGHHEVWKNFISATQQVTSFIEDRVLKELNKPLIIAIDHADKLIGTDLSADFFPMLRHWHNNRFKGNGWEIVDLVIVISTDPKLLIKDDRESPFNVSTIIYLDDFSHEDIVKLNSVYKNLFSAENLHQLHKILNGHPYLTRLAMDAVYNNFVEQPQLTTFPLGKHSPFTGYLKSLSAELTANPDLLKSLKQIIDHKHPNKQSINVLLQAGIIQVTNGQLDFRNTLYRQYFKEIL